MARLNWAKNEQLRRMQRFGVESAGVEAAPAPSTPPLKKGKRKKKARRAPAEAPRSSRHVEPSASPAPEVVQRALQELHRLDQEISDLDQRLRALRARRVAAVAALQKLTPPGQAFHPPKLITAADAARRRPRRGPPANTPSKAAKTS